MSSSRFAFLFQFVASALLGAATWLAWLGWDRTASYDVVTDSVQSPYVTLQVLGCALTVGIVTAVLAARWTPFTCAAGVGVGFWSVWTVDAASQDVTGLFAVGSMMVGVGLTVGTLAAASAGRGLRSALEARRRRRGNGDDSGGLDHDTAAVHLVAGRQSPVRWSLVGVGIVVLLTGVVAGTVTPGIDVNGAAAVTVTADGHPVAVLELCHGAVQAVDVVGPNRGDEPNEVHAALTADRGVRRSTAVDLSNPGGDWRGDPLKLPLDDSLYVVSATTSDSNLRDVIFTPAELGALTPEEVLYSEYDAENDRGSRSVVIPRSEFRAIACAD